MKERKIIKDIKSEIEYLLENFAYRMYWDMGKYHYKRMIYNMITNNEEFEFINEMFLEVNSHKHKYLKDIEEEWYKNTFKKICLKEL